VSISYVPASVLVAESLPAAIARANVLLPTPASLAAFPKVSMVMRTPRIGGQ
jgi:hypothetical protein